LERQHRSRNRAGHIIDLNRKLNRREVGEIDDSSGFRHVAASIREPSAEIHSLWGVLDLGIHVAVPGDDAHGGRRYSSEK
jgi:hypothetical protein